VWENCSAVCRIRRSRPEKDRSVRRREGNRGHRARVKRRLSVGGIQSCISRMFLEHRVALKRVVSGPDWGLSLSLISTSTSCLRATTVLLMMMMKAKQQTLKPSRYLSVSLSILLFVCLCVPVYRSQHTLHRLSHSMPSAATERMHTDIHADRQTDRRTHGGRRTKPHT